MVNHGKSGAMVKLGWLIDITPQSSGETPGVLEHGPSVCPPMGMRRYFHSGGFYNFFCWLDCSTWYMVDVKIPLTEPTRLDNGLHHNLIHNDLDGPLFRQKEWYPPQVLPASQWNIGRWWSTHHSHGAGAEFPASWGLLTSVQVDAADLGLHPWHLHVLLRAAGHREAVCCTLCGARSFLKGPVAGALRAVSTGRWSFRKDDGWIVDDMMIW